MRVLGAFGARMDLTSQDSSLHNTSSTKVYSVAIGFFFPGYITLDIWLHAYVELFIERLFINKKGLSLISAFLIYTPASQLGIGDLP